MIQTKLRKLKENADCNIAVDVAVFSPINGSKIIYEESLYSSIFTFYIEPLDIGMHSFPIHVIIMKDGFADETILNKRKELIDILRANNINYIFKSTDGDHFFDAYHENAFAEYKNLLESGAAFEAIIQKVKKHNFHGLWSLNYQFHSF